jgi:hypothetical protein
MPFPGKILTYGSEHPDQIRGVQVTMVTKIVVLSSGDVVKIEAEILWTEHLVDELIRSIEGVDFLTVVTAKDVESLETLPDGKNLAEGIDFKVNANAGYDLYKKFEEACKEAHLVRDTMKLVFNGIFTPKYTFNTYDDE